MPRGRERTFQFQHRFGRLPAHVVNGILISQPVASLDGVVHVPAPVVLRHVAKRRVDAALRGHRVRAGGEELGDAGRPEAGLGEAHGGAEAAAAASHDHGIVLVVDDGVLADRAAAAACRGREAPPGRCRRGRPPRGDSRRGARQHCCLDL